MLMLGILLMDMVRTLTFVDSVEVKEEMVTDGDSYGREYAS